MQAISHQQSPSVLHVVVVDVVKMLSGQLRVDCAGLLLKVAGTVHMAELRLFSIFFLVNNQVREVEVIDRLSAGCSL